jgi:bifunctional non-homologous end joining protein LigD
VKTVPVPRRRGGPDIRYIVINDRATLAWCASIANIEIHPFLHRVPALDTPTAVVFDLDPGEGANVVTCAEVAFWLKDALDQLGLQAFAKVSGSKGLQVYVPLNTGARYDQTQPFARQLAQHLEREHPELVVADMDKHLRTGKVFIDWSQNADFKTTVAVYSLRAKRERPFVSMPVTWSELQRALQTRSPDDLSFDPAAALRRLGARRDLFAPVLRLKQRLPDGFATELRVRRRRPSGANQTTTPSAPRRSHQGGRRRFVVENDGARSIVRLETSAGVKSWALSGAPPTRAGEGRAAEVLPDRPVTDLAKRGRGRVWDAGIYEIVEGGLAAGPVTLYFVGGKLKGECMLAPVSPADGKRWRLVRPPA